MSEEPRKGGYLAQGWLVILLSLLYGGALAATQTALGPRIAENQRREAYRMIPTLVQVKGEGVVTPVVLTGEDGKKQEVFQVHARDGSLAGWVLHTGGQGFQDRIDLLVGVTADVSKITGLHVLDQKETPNLGSLVAEPAFRDQFRDMSTEQPVVVVTAEPTRTCEIRSVTGATISSASVAEMVNRAIANLKGPIRQHEAGRK